MGILDDLIGSATGAANTKSQGYRDFIDRFDKGSPYEDISDDEAAKRYGEVAPELSRDDYRDSARAAFERLSPQERQEFGQWLRERGRAQGGDMTDLDGDGVEDRMQDPGELAEMTTRVRDRDPNVLEQLLGRGGTGGAFDNPIAKIAFAGIAAMAANRLMGGRR
jgi:hypothetical protein